MQISDQELRALVRDAIARHVRPEAPPPAVDSARVHGSHGLLAGLASGDDQGLCLIEPTVGCTHCGYCQSLGH